MLLETEKNDDYEVTATGIDNFNPYPKIQHQVMLHISSEFSRTKDITC